MSSPLRIAKESFRTEAQARIAEGQAIVEQFTTELDAKSFRKLYRESERWSRNNHAWLGYIATKAPGTQQRGYENAGAWDTEKLGAARFISPDSLEYKARFFVQTVTSKIEYLEDLLDTIDYLVFLPESEPGLPEPTLSFTNPTVAVNNEEIIKKQAQEAVTTAERYGIHNHQGKYIEALREQSLKLYQPAAKVTYFQEAIRLVEEKIAAHRLVCKEGPGCPKEKKYEEAIFFLQQELDILPKPIQIPPSLPQPVAMANTNTALEKIFISHSSKDAPLVEEVIELLEVIGIRAEQIFCSSFEGYSIDLGQDFLQRIKDELNSNVLVLFVLTPNFYNSPVSLCEMGASWVRTSKHIPIVVPPLSYDDVKGVIPLTQGFKINEAKKWNMLKGQLEQWFELQPIILPVWERKRDRVIQIIDEKIARATTKPAEAQPAPRRDSDLSHFGGISV